MGNYSTDSDVEYISQKRKRDRSGSSSSRISYEAYRQRRHNRSRSHSRSRRGVRYSRSRSNSKNHSSRRKRRYNSSSNEKSTSYRSRTNRSASPKNVKKSRYKRSKSPPRKVAIERGKSSKTSRSRKRSVSTSSRSKRKSRSKSKCRRKDANKIERYNSRISTSEESSSSSSSSSCSSTTTSSSEEATTDKYGQRKKIAEKSQDSRAEKRKSSPTEIDLISTSTVNVTNKTPVIDLAGNMEYNRNAIDDINNPAFVQRAFVSNKSGNDVPGNENKQKRSGKITNSTDNKSVTENDTESNVVKVTSNDESTSKPSSIVSAKTCIENNTVFHDDLFLENEDERVKKWVKKLYTMRQRFLVGVTKRNV